MNALNLFKASADETRLRLVNLVLHYELNVNEITTILHMGQSRISRHLKILTDGGLLRSRRDGLWTFYSAAGDGEGHTFIEAVKYLFDHDPLYAADLKEAERVLDERAKETVKFFDTIAEDWEKLKREIIGSLDLNALILNHIPPSDTVVDLGCGTGDLLPALKQKGSRVIGVERSQRMLEAARRRLADEMNQIHLRVGELEHLPLRENETDAAVINMVLHHLPEPLKAIREAHRVLQPGTPLIIADLLSHGQDNMRERYGDRWLGFSKVEIEKWLEDGGFKVKKIEYFDLKKKLKGFIITAVKKIKG